MNNPRIVCSACVFQNGLMVVDQFGRFYNKREAWVIADMNGQIIRRCGGDTEDGGTLYSENLY